MPLRETLQALQKREKQVEWDDRAARIAEWQTAVAALLEQMREYLSEYEQDGSLSIEPRKLWLTEEDLGTYEIAAMDVRVGLITIPIEPVALLVSGAEGRVDMHRQGRSSEEDRIMLLRMRLSGPAHPAVWCINSPPDPATPGARVYPHSLGTRTLTPLSKATLEDAIEFLLK